MLAVRRPELERVAGQLLEHEVVDQAEFRALEGAGHWLHADRPRETAAAIAEFVNR